MGILGKSAETEVGEVKAKSKVSTAFSLPQEIIKVEFIKRQKGSITNEKHVLYGGMGESATRELVPRRNQKTFKFIQILSPEEQEYLEDALALPKGGLSVYKPEDNYWSKVKVLLTKEGIDLDLSDPIGYIHYKVVMSYDNLVAPSLAEKKRINKGTYQFVIVRPGEAGNEVIDLFNVKKEAYKLLDRIESSIDNTREFLYLAGVTQARTGSVKWLKARLATMVETEPNKIVDIVGSSDYGIRALISKGVLSGVIKDLNGRYQLEDGVMLAEQGEVSSLSNAIFFLQDKKNAEVKNRIEAKIGI